LWAFKRWAPRDEVTSHLSMLLTWLNNNSVLRLWAFLVDNRQLFRKIYLIVE
jgi:hypothetical protein